MNKSEAETIIKNTIEYANNEIQKNKQKTRRIIATVISVAAILIMWIVLSFVDYIRVSSFELPIFCVSRESVYKGAEDYRHCQGLGYSFEIVVNDPQSEYPGVTRYTYFILGNEISSGIRD